MTDLLISVTRYKGYKITVYQDERGIYFTRVNDKKNATVYYFNTELKALDARKAEIDEVS
jgi:hypothetical protein